MRKNFTLLLLLLCTAFYARRAVLFGKIAHLNAATVEASYDPGVVSPQEIKRTASVDKQGNFKLVFDLLTIQEILLTVNRQQMRFYLEPGDSIALSADYVSFVKSLGYSGDRSSKNTFYKAWCEKFVRGHDQDVFQQNVKRDAMGFAKWCDSLLNQKNQFMLHFMPRPAPEFVSYFRTTLFYENATNKLQYAAIHARLLNKGDTLPHVPLEYYSFVPELDLNHEQWLNNAAYYHCLVAVAEYSASLAPRAPGQRLTVTDYMNTAFALFKNPRILEAYEAGLVNTWLSDHNFAEAEPLYLNYERMHPASAYLAELKQHYTKLKQQAPAQPVPAQQR